MHKPEAPPRTPEVPHIAPDDGDVGHSQSPQAQVHTPEPEEEAPRRPPEPVPVQPPLEAEVPRRSQSYKPRALLPNWQWLHQPPPPPQTLPTPTNPHPHPHADVHVHVPDPLAPIRRPGPRSPPQLPGFGFSCSTISFRVLRRRQKSFIQERSARTTPIGEFAKTTGH